MMADLLILPVHLIALAMMWHAWSEYELRRVKRKLSDRQFDLYLREMIAREVGPDITVGKITRRRRKK